ncbi:azurin [Sphingobacterium sp. DK4209]|uniref:Azurin n=1 Tax=Sphingobacterium zhuxiongii TaxID=2662364 RepID=A0A5Q0Q7U0_9SPHI|nr:MULTISPECIES: azurin [unclassified Sphingobacterium]MVZ64986.1 azurin [Sphingobacterium sp. DK4209]QGA25324.1 azurin [Sphingobacterium sp. dk4302]
MKKLILAPALALAIAVSSCGNNAEKKEETTSTETTPTEAPATTTEETVPGIENVTSSQTWTVEGNDQMQYNINLIRVKAGEAVEITVKNVGSMPKESMGHNLVILKPGIDIPTFGSEASAAADSEYIPKSSLTSIVAHSKLLGPGESDKISVTLEKGVYSYICSFPGHFGIMQGKIVAE